MWAWMDRIGITLFDATLSAAVFLTFIVLAMLACRQPARRILLARVALLASLAIVPIVGWGACPGSTSSTRSSSRASSPRPCSCRRDPPASPTTRRRSCGLSNRSRAGCCRDGSPTAPTARQWLPRGLTVVDLACVAAGSAWLILGLVGVHWLIRRSRPPTLAARALFDELVAGRSRAARRRTCASARGSSIRW